MNSVSRKILAALITPLAAAYLTLSAEAKTPAIYTVAKVDVSAEADNAVAAKEKALAEAQQIALRRLFKRLTAFSAQAKLPVLSNDLVERMVDGFAVRRESNSATRYIATLDFTFEPNAVRDILNRFALPYTDQQSNEALLIPIMIEGGSERPGSEILPGPVDRQRAYEYLLAFLDLAGGKILYLPHLHGLHLESGKEVDLTDLVLSLGEVPRRLVF